MKQEIVVEVSFKNGDIEAMHEDCEKALTPFLDEFADYEGEDKLDRMKAWMKENHPTIATRMATYIP